MCAAISCGSRPMSSTVSSSNTNQDTIPGAGGETSRCVPLFRAGQDRCPRPFHRRAQAPGPRPPGSGRRVRQPEQLQAQRDVLLRRRRQAGLRPLPRPEHHDPQGGRIRRGHRRLLQGQGPLAPMSGSPTSASRPRGASGIPPAPTPSRASTSPWSTTGISPITIPSASICCSATSGRSFSRTRRSRSSCSTS